MSRKRGTKRISRKPEPIANEPVHEKSGPSIARFGLYVGVFMAGSALTALAFLMVSRIQAEPESKVYEPPKQTIDYARPWRAGAIPNSLYDLLKMPRAELAEVDFALMNLLCAQDLPGAEDIDIPTILRKLDHWAGKVAFETERHLYRVKDPRYADHYKYSEARLRAEFIVQVLQEDCGVHYNIDRIRDVDFANSQDLFIHGMLGSDNGGTCASLPVIYTAIGRRLGYPMSLALAREHIFVRWDDGNERFNVEGAGNGGIDFPEDEFYRFWRHPINDKMMATGEFLKTLTPEEELSVFLLNRGVCLHAHRRDAEAAEAYALAHRLMPNAASQKLALATAARGLPMPNRHRKQQSVDVTEILNMQRDAFSRSQRRDTDDPTPRIPKLGLP